MSTLSALSDACVFFQLYCLIVSSVCTENTLYRAIYYNEVYKFEFEYFIVLYYEYSTRTLKHAHLEIRMCVFTTFMTIWNFCRRLFLFCNKR